MNSTVEAIQALTAAVGGETPEKVLQTVDALRQLYVAMGGDVANVADISTIPDAVGKLATVAGEMADSVGMFIDVIEGDIVNLQIPKGVTTIGDAAFYSCTSLASVTIPEGVTTIGDDAFSDMPAGSHIYCGFSKGDVSGAPWGATNATIVYDYTPT